MSKCYRTAAALLFQAAVVACARYEASASTDSTYADSVARAKQDSVNRTQPGYVVDSIFPIAEEIRRFNAELAPPAALGGPAINRADLVRRFTAALVARDTAALRELFVTRAEFGHLLFPETEFTRSPYKTKPSVIWMQLVNETDRGISRLLERLRGPSLELSALQCPDAPIRRGRSTYWRRCTLLVGTAMVSPPRRMRLFGQIVERDGHAKFMSYGGDF